VSSQSNFEPRSYVGWVCRRCGLGLICDDEPGHCGCWAGTALHGSESEYERVELVEAARQLAAEEVE
jgi:hypothetical protein